MLYGPRGEPGARGGPYIQGEGAPGEDRRPLLFIPVKFNPLNTELYARGVVRGMAPAAYDVRSWR
jgi:hypothetical protein